MLAGRDGGIVATGAVAPGGSLDVAGNKIATGGQGIVVGADATVDANTVNRLGDDPGTDGIVVEAGPISIAPGDVRITGNRVHDRAGIGIALRTAVRSLIVKQNVVATVGAGIIIAGRGGADRVTVDNNEVFDVASVEDAAFGIALGNVGSAAVHGNTVVRVGPELTEGGTRAGIAVYGSADVRIDGNVVDEIGRLDGYVGAAAGVLVVGPFDRVSVAENSIRFNPKQLAPSDGIWWALRIISAGKGLTRMASGTAVVPVSKGAVVVNGAWGYVAPTRDDHVGVTANHVSGGGRQPACEVDVLGDAVAEANQCRHEGSEIGVLLTASSVIASSNRVRGERSMLVLMVPENRFAAVGNLAAGGTHLGGPGAGLPGPWDPLNPIVS